MRQRLHAVQYRVQQKTSGKPGFFSLTRKFFWAWWFWAVAGAAAGTYDHDKMAIGFCSSGPADKESNISVYEHRLAGQLENIFMEDLKVCERITFEQWQRRGLKTRVLGVLSLIFKDQI